MIAAVSIASENASAYEKNQATSQTSACGNEFIPINIGCQNTNSQVQGDENGVALTAQQTFPEVKLVQEKPSHPPKTPPSPPPEEICGDQIDNDGDGMVDEDCPTEPQTCIECFANFLTETQMRDLENIMLPVGEDRTLERYCAIESEENPQQIQADLGFLAVVLERPTSDLGLGLDPQLVDQLIECLEEAFGLQTEEPLES